MCVPDLQFLVNSMQFLLRTLATNMTTNIDPKRVSAQLYQKQTEWLNIIFYLTERDNSGHLFTVVFVYCLLIITVFSENVLLNLD